MSRPRTLLVVVLVIAPAFGPTAPGVIAQTLDAKAIAKIRFDATTADLRELLRARRDVARRIYDTRRQQFDTGRGNEYSLLAWSESLRDAELALADSEASRAAALERHWERAWHIDTVNTESYEAGRLGSVRDYWVARYHRLSAEIAWARARKAIGPPLAPGAGTEARTNPLATEELARAKFAATYPDVRKLAETRLDIARRRYVQQMRVCLEGWGSFGYLHDSSLRVVESELELADTPADRVASWERHWKHMKMAEVIVWRGEQVGRVPLEYYLVVRSYQLDAEIRLARLRAGPGGRSVPAGSPWISPQEPADVFTDKEIATWKVAAARRDLGKLLRTRRDTIRAACEELEKQLRGRPGDREIYVLRAGAGLVAWASVLVDAELELCTTATERIAALEKYRDQVLRLEELHRQWYGARKISAPEYWAAVYTRLDAQIRSAQAGG